MLPRDQARRKDVGVVPLLVAGEFRERLGPGLTSDDVGKAIVELVGSEEHAAGAYTLTPAGLSFAG